LVQTKLLKNILSKNKLDSSEWKNEIGLTPCRFGKTYVLGIVFDIVVWEKILIKSLFG
jgi:hypothetical protein